LEHNLTHESDEQGYNQHHRSSVDNSSQASSSNGDLQVLREEIQSLRGSLAVSEIMSFGFIVWDHFVERDISIWDCN
jgi:hypothetical protein